MVAGHLLEKDNKYHIVLEYKDINGKRKKKQKCTALPMRGNKKKAEEMLLAARRSFVPPGTASQRDYDDILFADFLHKWLEVKKTSIKKTTYNSYKNNMKVIDAWFRERAILLKDIKPMDIQDFYLLQSLRVSGTTVLKYHANIHACLKYAYRMDLIAHNPADKVTKPQKNDYVAKHLSLDEARRIFELAKGHTLEVPIVFGIYYGMRRSEVLGKIGRAHV